MSSHLIAPIPATSPNEFQLQQIERRFGMFLHFGVNTFGNVEWSDGGIQALSYQPSSIDADQWIRTAYEAGMNYVILITKHHDGFCLWDTDTTAYSVKHSGNPTDVVKAVAEACQKYGVKLGLYYSLWDRSEPTYKSDFANGYISYMLRQLTELMDGRYGEIVELWLDGGWDKPRSQWRLDLIYDCVKRLQPQCQIGVNLTVGEDRDQPGEPDKRYLPPNYQEGDPLQMFPPDFRLWDPYMCRPDDPKLYTFGGETYYLPFEMTICSRKGASWFYSNIYEGKELMDAEEIAQNCRTLFACQNLAVINLPPDTNGRLVQGDIDNLMKVADLLGIRRHREK